LNDLMCLFPLFPVDENNPTFDGADSERAQVLEGSFGHDSHLFQDRPKDEKREKVKTVLVVNDNDGTLSGHGLEFFNPYHVPVLQIDEIFETFVQ
jgi:hypothetical protein